MLAAVCLEITEHRAPSFQEMDLHESAIVGRVTSLDQPTPLHPLDDAGRARVRHVEAVGELAHRQRTLSLENRKHVEVDEAEGTAMPAAEHPYPVVRAPFGQLTEQIVGEDLPFVSYLGLAWHCIDLHCHVKDLGHAWACAAEPNGPFASALEDQECRRSAPALPVDRAG